MKEHEAKLLRDHPVGISWDDPTVTKVTYSRFGPDWMYYVPVSDHRTVWDATRGREMRVEEISLLAKDGTRLGRITGLNKDESVMHLMLRLRKEPTFVDVYYLVRVDKQYSPPAPNADDDDDGNVTVEVTIAEAWKHPEPWKVCERMLEWIASLEYDLPEHK